MATAIMTAPSGNILAYGTSQLFAWTSADADFYQILVGTTPGGSYDITSANISAPNTIFMANGLPTDGSTVYVRLYSVTGSTWTFNDYAYTTLRLFPTISRRNATTFKFKLTPNTQRGAESPLDKTQQTYELPGARWSFTGTWENISDLDARIIKGWLAKLRGAAGRFYMWDMQHPAPSGLAYGAGTLGGYVADNVLTTSWSVALSLTADNTHFRVNSSLINTTSSTLIWFQPGDYIGVNGELKMVTDVARGDGTGGVTISVEPPFRTTPPTGAPITFIRPTCVMRLIDDNQDNFEYSRDRNLTSITISGIEVF